MTYDPAFAYELAVIVQDGMRRMYQEGEDIFLYLSLYNENYPMPPMPEGVEDGILKGLYKYRKGAEDKKHKAHIFGSGTIIRQALRAQEILAKRTMSPPTCESVTSYKLLKTECATREPLEHAAPDRAAAEVLLGNAPARRARRVCGCFETTQSSCARPDSRTWGCPADLPPSERMVLAVATRVETSALLRDRRRMHRHRHALTRWRRRARIEMTTVAQAIQDLKVDPEKGAPVLPCRRANLGKRKLEWTLNYTRLGEGAESGDSGQHLRQAGRTRSKRVKRSSNWKTKRP